MKLPRKEFNYHLFGRFVHRILELFHLAYINGSLLLHEQQMSASFNEAVQEFKGKLTLPQKEEAYSIIAAYLGQLQTNKFAQSRVVSVEQTFNHEINDGLILTGMIDRVQLDDDGVYHIVDYKTSKTEAYLKNDLLQLLTYAYVIYSEHPEITKVRVSYIMLRLGCKFITKEFDLKEILGIKSTYEQYAEKIHAETEFAPSPQVLCSWCEFADVCPASKEVIEKRWKTGKVQW